MGAALKSPYQVLGLQEDADPDRIRQAFRDRIRAYHDGRLSEVKFRFVCRAFECLTDDSKRREFQQHRRWIYRIPLDDYTTQQLVCEPRIFKQLVGRLERSTLKQLNQADPMSGQTLLYCAARVRNVLAVRYLILRGVDLDGVQTNGSTALHVAAYYGHANVVRALLQNGANCTLKNRFALTAEMESYGEGVKDVFESLRSSPIVHVAANDLDWLRENPLRVRNTIHSRTNSSLQTFLHCASRKGSLDLVRWLVEECRADLDAVDANFNSSLHLAAIHGHANVVEYLLQRGANPLLPNRCKRTAEKESEGMAAIFEAMRRRNAFEMAEEGFVWWFRYYFADGDVNAVNAQGVTLLYVACRHGHTSIVQFLLERGARVNASISSRADSTALHVAVYSGHDDIVRLLLLHGAPVSPRNRYGATVFDECFAESTRKIIEEFREKIKDENTISISIYNEESIVRGRDWPERIVYLRFDANYGDLLRNLPQLATENRSFAVAGRPLTFENEQRTILDAVARVRYSQNHFFDDQLHLTYRNGSNPPVDDGHPAKEWSLSGESARAEIESKGKKYVVDLKFASPRNGAVRINDLVFIVDKDENMEDISITIDYLPVGPAERSRFAGCLCLFKITYVNRWRLISELEVLHRSNPKALLYASSSSSSTWFRSSRKPNHLTPTIDEVYGFFFFVDVIPCFLTLPSHMILAANLNRPLTERTRPAVCQALEIRSPRFPHTAYHGTHISSLQSILTDGLVLPQTVVSNGRCVRPLWNHIPLHVSNDGIANYSYGIFVSPSVFYSSASVYSQPFLWNGQRTLTVLECSVKSGSFTIHPSTVPAYVPHPNDDLASTEWRITDPSSIEINAVLFIAEGSLSTCTRL